MINQMYMISVVQAYINHVKGVTVQISIPTTQKQLRLLNTAYNKANEYFSINNGSVSLRNGVRF